MNILDEDMQMVRDFLAQANAPEYIKGHFENLVSEYAKEAMRAEQLLSDFNDMSVKAADRDTAQVSALETVKYWLHDVLVLGGPMRKSPKEILRIVEDVL